MKKYIIIIGLVILSGITIVRADTKINGQFESFVSQVQELMPIISGSTPNGVVKPGTNSFYATIQVNPVIQVPSDIFVAHILTPTGKIDVQRFIDPSTSVACYYSEITNNGSVTVIPQCMVVDKNAK